MSRGDALLSGVQATFRAAASDVWATGTGSESMRVKDTQK
jgi:hypothetical protein